MPPIRSLARLPFRHIAFTGQTHFILLEIGPEFHHFRLRANQRDEAPSGGLLGEQGAAWAARHEPFGLASPAGAAAGACSAASRVA
jgi:hypothetical protein